MVLFEVKNPSVHRLPLLQRRAQRPVQPVLEVQLSSPRNDVGKQISVEGGVLFEQRLEVQGPLSGHELVQPDLVRSDGGPLLLHVAVIWIRAHVPHTLENHADHSRSHSRADTRADIVTIRS